jgi:hypothetical protein
VGLGRKQRQKQTKATAIDQSFRPSDFTPAFGRAVAPFGAAFIRRAEALRFQGEGIGVVRL